jgi:uncharacterized protein YfeS
MIRILQVVVFALIAMSCATNKPANLELNETEIWELSYRMVKSGLLNDVDQGVKQFDSLLDAHVKIEPKILNAGLELLHKKGEHQRIREILNTADNQAKVYICQKDWITQPPYKEEGFCSDNTQEKQAPKNPELQKELVIMFYNDQTVRGADMSGIAAKFGLNPDSISYKLDGVATDALNREKLKAILANYGFPDKSIVGEIGMESIFFIIQHADMDKEFQKSQLPSIEQAVKKGDLDGQKYAYLYDRIKTNEGEPQLYGTQFSNVDSEKNIAELAPVADIENLDKRRKEIGMMPISIYKELMLAFRKSKQ